MAELVSWHKRLTYNQAKLRFQLGEMAEDYWDEYRRTWLEVHGEHHNEPFGTAGSVLNLEAKKKKRNPGAL